MSGDGTLYRYKSNNKWYLIISHGWDPTLRNGKGGYKQQWIDLKTTDKNVAKENKKTILAELKSKADMIHHPRIYSEIGSIFG